MTLRYIISPTATRDLEEILDYFFERSIEAGEAFTDEFERKCQNIVRFPNLGRSYAELAPSLRGVPLQGYIVFYTVTENCIEISRIASGRRNLDKLFSDLDLPESDLPDSKSE